MTIKKLKTQKSKLKAQNSKPQLKTQNHLFCHPERSEGSHASSLSRHPEGAARRIPCPAAEGFFANAQNDNEKLKTQKSKLKATTQNLKTIRLSS